MSSGSHVIKLDEIENTPLRRALMEESNWQADLNYCMACGKCPLPCQVKSSDRYAFKLL